MLARPVLTFVGGSAIGALIASALAIFAFGDIDPKFRDATAVMYGIDVFLVLAFAVPGTLIYLVLIAIGGRSANVLLTNLRTKAFVLGFSYSSVVRLVILVLDRARL